MLNELEKNEEIKPIIQRNRLNVLAAALCHDLGQPILCFENNIYMAHLLGHGCFSHTYDSFLENAGDDLQKVDDGFALSFKLFFVA